MIADAALTQASVPPPSPLGGAALYVVRVVDSVDERIAGHGSCAYTSPPQSRGDGLALARLLLGGPVAVADPSEHWTRTVAIAGGRRTVTLERADHAH